MSENGSALALPGASQGPRASERRLAPLPLGPGLDRAQVDLLKRTVAKGVSDDELALFVHVANRAGLDPFAKQVHAVRRFDRKANREVMTIQTGIDGFRLIAARTGLHAGTDDAVFEERDGRPVKATVTVWKIVGGARVAFTATARWEEYVQVYRDRETGREQPSGLWGKMPFTMLAKCAEALALRKAFPADLSGVYSHEEMVQADAAGETLSEPAAAEAPAVDGQVVPPTAEPAKAPIDETEGLRRDLARLAKEGGASDLKRVAEALKIQGGRPLGAYTPEEIDRLWRHTVGGEPLPAPAAPTPGPSTSDDSAEGKKLNASIPF